MGGLEGGHTAELTLLQLPEPGAEVSPLLLHRGPRDGLDELST